MFAISQLRRVVRDRMQSGKPGDIITAEEMGRVLQQPCNNSRDKGWAVVAREIPALENQFAVFWRWNGEGKLWRCLADNEKPKDCQQRLGRIRKAARRNVLIAKSVDYSRLDEHSKASLGVSMVVSGVIEIATRGKTRERLTYGEAKDGGYIPTEQSLLTAMASRHKNGG